MRTPLHRFNNDMVFVDGRFLQSAGWEGGLDANTYFVDYEGGFVYIAVDPKDHVIEITAHDSAFVRTTRPVHGKQTDRRGPSSAALRSRSTPIARWKWTASNPTRRRIPSRSARTPSARRSKT